MKNSSNFVKSILETAPSKRTTVRVDQYLVKNETWQEAVARVLLTGLLKNNFYVSADQMAKEALPLMLKAAKEDPKFLLKAACMARDSHMKGMVKVALAAINGTASERFLKTQKTRNAAIALLSTFHPGQLLQFVELCKSKAFGRGFGARPQKWVRTVMEGWNAYKLETYTFKYPTALNQLVRLVHPRYRDDRAGVVQYILDGKKSSATGQRQLVLERLKTKVSKGNTLATRKNIAKSIIDYNIPWDVMKGFAGFQEPLGLAYLTQMNLTALLLNVASLEKHNVLSSRDGLKAFQLKLNEVKNGRAIALDFAKPYQHVTNSNVKDLLLQAMADTLDVPLPFIEGKRIGVSVDISGSMSGENLIQAGLMTIPFLKARNFWFTTFDTHLYEEGVDTRPFSYYGRGGVLCPKISGKSRIEQIKALLSLRTNGGTDTSVSLVEAIKTRRKLDVHVIITDEHQNAGAPLMTVWKEYKSRVNPNAELWIIDISNSAVKNVDLNDPSIVVYHAITPAVFNNLKYSGMDLVQAINKFDIDSFISN